VRPGAQRERLVPGTRAGGAELILDGLDSHGPAGMVAGKVPAPVCAGPAGGSRPRHRFADDGLYTS
jgi:hypothetical protein